MSNRIDVKVSEDVTKSEIELHEQLKAKGLREFHK